MPDLIRTSALVPQPASDTPVEARQMPGRTELTTEEREAVERLLRVLDSVVPLVPRTLRDDEQRQLLAEAATIKDVLGVLDRRWAAIRTIVFTHLDIPLGVADEDKQGFKLIAGQITSDGIDARLTREIQGPPELSVEGLREALERGDLTVAEFAGMVQTVEIINQAGVLDFQQAHGTRATEILGRASVAGQKLAKFVLRRPRRPRA